MLEKPNQESVPSYKSQFAEKADVNGFLLVGEFATRVLRRQLKSVAALLDGDEGTSEEQNLGEGLRFEGTSGNYSDMKIHIDDLDEFISRVKEYFEKN